MLGLRTAIYKVDDLEAAKTWYAKAFQTRPYFDNPSLDATYVGFNVGGFELGLMTDDTSPEAKTANVLAYWGVENIEAEFTRLTELGAAVHAAPMNVGGDIMVASVIDPWGNALGLIYNPEFEAS